MLTTAPTFHNRVIITVPASSSSSSRAVLVVQLLFVQEIRLINGGRCIDYYWVLGIG